MLTTEEAIRVLRQDPRWQALIHEAYLGPDLREAARRFEASAEFGSVIQLLGGSVSGQEILDLGAGNGIASVAFARNGARMVYALEPDGSGEIGRGALQELARGLSVTVLDGVGERLPLASNSVDVVYTRQVLHHTRSLPQVMRECQRVLKPGGLFLACREHVVSNRRQLQQFLRAHPVHGLTGGENAFRLREYLGAIRGSGLNLLQTLGPWDSVINAFPEVRCKEELAPYLRKVFHNRLGVAGGWLARWPAASAILRRLLNRRGAGRLYSFLAQKPARPTRCD
jgi:SAM-dependent methyltransferase